jgi:hypothetical protein
MKITQLLPALTLLLAATAWATEVPIDLQYDSGTAQKGLQLNVTGADGKPTTMALPVGTILATRFRPEHPMRLDSIELAFFGAKGPIEVHVWRDNGGSQPGAPGGLFTEDPAADRIAPRKTTTGKDGEFVTFDLSAEAVDLQPLELFWVGVKLVTPGTNVAIDGIEQGKTDITSLLQTPADPCADGCGVPGNLMIRAHGRYMDPLAKRWFTDATVAAGIQTGGRMAFGDYDGDGDDDLLFSSGFLYRNDGKGHFEDVSKASGIQGFSGSGALWGDYDNDGHLDIWVFGMTEHLLKNQGDGTFKEVTPGAFFDSDKYPTEGAVWLDVDNDGRLDLYDANYEWYHKDDKGTEILSDCGDDLLWHNNGDGTFTDVSVAAGIRKSGKQCGRGPAAVDYDQDGDQDLFVNNYRLHPDFFWRNDAPDLHFTDIAKKNGTRGSGKQGAYGHGTGAQWVDADNDGDFDLFAANLAHPRFIAFSDRSRFLRNEGQAGAWGFTELRDQTGIGYAETQSAPAFADFDNDGDMDLAVGAYYGDRMGQLWRNDGKADDPALWLKFSDQTYATGWITYGCASIAWADVDGDGDLDNVANDKLFRNDYADVSGQKGHWLKVRLHGAQKVNRAAIGAWVTVETGDGNVMSRVVSGGQGLATQDSLTLHFGLGAATSVQKVTVHWPGLPSETFGPYPADGLIEVTEGKGATAITTTLGADAGSTGTDASPASDSQGTGTTGKASASSGCTAAGRPQSSWWMFGLAFCLVVAVRSRRRGRA